MTVFASLGEAWIALLDEILECGELVRDDDRKIMEVRNVACLLASIDEADPIITQLADPDRIELMCRKYASTELVTPYPVSYGGRIRAVCGIDQVADVIRRLIRKPETKSACITLHLPGDDYIPCLTGLDFKVRGDHLTMSAIYRSQNVFGSQPGNLIALRRLQHEVAEQSGIAVGDLALHVMSAHVYDSDWESAESAVRRGSEITGRRN